jgi:hypothetical protein
MFKHTTPYPWVAQNSNVWDYEATTIISSCASRNLPLATQRANARLIAIAPQMYEIIQKMQSEDAKALVRYMEREIEHAD